MARARLNPTMRPAQPRGNAAISLCSAPGKSSSKLLVRSGRNQNTGAVFLGGAGFAKLLASRFVREGHPSSVGRAADS